MKKLPLGFFPEKDSIRPILESKSRLFKLAKKNLSLGRTLDAGAGNGRFSRKWQQIGNQVFAMDIGTSLIDDLPLVIQGDITHLPFKDETFESIFSASVLEIPDIEGQGDSLLEMKRVLKINGRAFITYPIRGSLYGIERRVGIKFGWKRYTRWLPHHIRPLNELISRIEAVGFKIQSRKIIRAFYPIELLARLIDYLHFTFCYKLRITANHSLALEPKVIHWLSPFEDWIPFCVGKYLADHAAITVIKPDEK